MWCAWCIVAAAAVACPSSVRAQNLSARAEDGEGIKVGPRSTFHPGVSLSGGVDSNVFYADRTNEASQVRAAGFVMPAVWARIGNRAVRDGVLMTPPQQTARKADFSIGAFAAFRQYLTGDESVTSQGRVQLGLDGHLMAFPGRRFSFELSENLQRRSEPRNQDVGAGFGFNRVVHNGAAKFWLRPGGGRLSLALGYRSDILRFSDDDPAVKNNDRMANQVEAEAKWRFFPRSSLVANYAFRHNFFLECCDEAGTGRNEDSYENRVTAGFRGDIFRRAALEAVAGFSKANYYNDINGPNFAGLLARLGFDYFPTVRSRVHLGVERAFSDSLLGNYFTDTVGRVVLGHQFRWRMTGRLSGAVSRRAYSGLPTPSEDARINGYQSAEGFIRRDIVVSGGARLEQPLGRRLAVGADYQATVIQTDFAVIYADGGAQYGAFNRHLVMLFFAARM